VKVVGHKNGMFKKIEDVRELGSHLPRR